MKMAVNAAFLLIFAGLLSHYGTTSLAMILNSDSQASSPAEVTFYQMRDANFQNLNIHVRAFEKTYELELFKAPSVFSPVYEQYLAKTDEDDNIVFEKIHVNSVEQIESKFYTNAEGSASLSINYADGHLSLEGILDHETYITRHDSTDRLHSANNVHHMAFKQLPVPANYECKALEPNITFTKLPITENDLNLRAAGASYQPEVLVVLDSTYYTYYGGNIDSIREYIGVFFNSINRRYDSVSSPKIQNIVSALIVSSSKEVFEIGSGSIIDGYETLPAFGKWLYDNRCSIPLNYDVAVWISGLDLATPSGSTYDSGLAGLAYVGAACNKQTGLHYNTGINEDKPGQYVGVHTVTHELAHLYGAAHDGDSINSPPGNPGSAACPWGDGYIMSYIAGSVNRFYFSQCSANSFAHTFASPYCTCLQRTQAVPLIPTLPGALVSPDQQCINNFGPSYYFYTPTINDICLWLWCHYPSSPTITSRGPALEGTYCNSAKTMRCLNGVCT